MLFSVFLKLTVSAMGFSLPAISYYLAIDNAMTKVATLKFLQQHPAATSHLQHE